MRIAGCAAVGVPPLLGMEGLRVGGLPDRPFAVFPDGSW